MLDPSQPGWRSSTIYRAVVPIVLISMAQDITAIRCLEDRGRMCLQSTDVHVSRIPS